MKIEYFNVLTNFRILNEHATDMVALKHLMYMHKAKFNGDDYKAMMALMDKMHEHDEKIFNSVFKQTVERYALDHDCQL